MGSPANRKKHFAERTTGNANPRHLKGLNAFAEEYNVKKSILVSNDPLPRQLNNITILPWNIFLDRLWNNEIMPA